MDIVKALYRSWEHFNTFYTEFFSKPVGIFTSDVTIYYLLINNIAFLKDIFPSFTHFLIASLFAYPVGALLGRWFSKHSKIKYQQEEVRAEASIYAYKAVPGKEQEATFPTLLCLAEAMEWMLSHGVYPEKTPWELVQSLETIQRKLKTLMEGGYVGVPKRRMER